MDIQMIAKVVARAEQIRVKQHYGYPGYSGSDREARDNEYLWLVQQLENKED